MTVDEYDRIVQEAMVHRLREVFPRLCVVGGTCYSKDTWQEHQPYEAVDWEDKADEISAQCFRNMNSA